MSYVTVLRVWSYISYTVEMLAVYIVPFCFLFDLEHNRSFLVFERSLLSVQYFALIPTGKIDG